MQAGSAGEGTSVDGREDASIGDVLRKALNIASIRHIQHHTAYLAGRVRATSGTSVEWVGSGRGVADEGSR